MTELRIVEPTRCLIQAVSAWTVPVNPTTPHFPVTAADNTVTIIVTGTETI